MRMVPSKKRKRNLNFFFSFSFLFVDLDPDGDGVMDDLPKADEYHRTVIGRKLLRRQLFWENFLKYMNIKVDKNIKIKIWQPVKYKLYFVVE